MVLTESFDQHKDPMQKESAFLFACHYDLFGLGTLRALFGTVRPGRYRVGCGTGDSQTTNVSVSLSYTTMSSLTGYMSFDSDRLKVYEKEPGIWPKMKCSAVYVLSDESEFFNFKLLFLCGDLMLFCLVIVTESPCII